MVILAVDCSFFFVAEGNLSPWRIVPSFTFNRNGRILYRTSTTRGAPTSHRLLIRCQAQSLDNRVRKYSPYLETTCHTDDAASTSYEWKAVPDIWRSSAEKYGDRTALLDPLHDPPVNMTYKQLEEEIIAFAEGLRIIGVLPNEKVALFADNSSRWLIADQGMMAMGAINVVRGSRSSVEELLEIYEHSDSVALVVDNSDFFNRIAGTVCSNGDFRFVILLWGDKRSLVMNGMKEASIYCYDDIIDLGTKSLRDASSSADDRLWHKHEAISVNDICTIVYTSGTTGNPKGVMLSHKNLLHQINNLADVVPAVPGDKFLSLLPPWHIYERTCEYFIFTCGVEQMYTSVTRLKYDLEQYQPSYLISVPLIYETLYSGIQKQIKSSTIRKYIFFACLKISLTYMSWKRIYEGACLTTNTKEPPRLLAVIDWLWAKIVAAMLFPLHLLATKLIYKKINAAIGIRKAGVSGGGSLPSHIDYFFEAIGINLQNGYGMTESSPVIAVRRYYHNVIGSVGRPVRHVQVKTVDAETNETLPPGSKGIIKVKGPLVMEGYYKNQSATDQTVDENGWLNTGDVGWIAPHHSVGRSRICGGVVVIEGRAKDTIVLSTGENVEPMVLEEAIMQSDLISQVVVIGQDQRRVGAIVVPNKEQALVAAKAESMVDADASELNEGQLTSLVLAEVRKWTSTCSTRIGPILVADTSFTIENGLLTPTMKIQRKKVMALYENQIASLYKNMT